MIGDLFNTVFDTKRKVPSYEEKQARHLYDSILKFFISGKEQGKIVTKDIYTKNEWAYVELKNVDNKDKIYLYILENTFKKYITDSKDFMKVVFDFWLKSGIDNSIEGKSQYRERITVGDKNERPWFYKFCMTDFENKLYMLNQKESSE